MKKARSEKSLLKENKNFKQLTYDEKIKKENDDLKNEIKELHRLISKMEKERRFYMNENVKKDCTYISDFEAKKLETIKGENEEKIKKLEEEIKNKNKENENLEKKIEELKNQSNNMENIYNEMTSKMEKLIKLFT